MPSLPIPPSLATALEYAGFRGVLVVERLDGQPLSPQDEALARGIVEMHEANISDSEIATAARKASVDKKARASTGERDMVDLPEHLASSLTRVRHALTLFTCSAPGLPGDVLRFGGHGAGVLLQLDLHSPALEPSVRERLFKTLLMRADAHGVVHFFAAGERSQYGNRQMVFDHLAAVLELTVPELLL